MIPIAPRQVPPLRTRGMVAAHAGMKPTAKTRKGTNALHLAAKKGKHATFLLILT